jgi:hypothetical protein
MTLSVGSDADILFITHATYSLYYTCDISLHYPSNIFLFILMGHGVLQVVVYLFFGGDTV